MLKDSCTALNFLSFELLLVAGLRLLALSGAAAANGGVAAARGGTAAACGGTAASRGMAAAAAFRILEVTCYLRKARRT